MLFTQKTPQIMGPDPSELAEITRNLARAVVEFPEVNWVDAVSHGQLASKLWLLDFMKGRSESFGTTWVIGGWVGMLPHLLLSCLPEKFDHIFTIDMDETACRAADRLLHHHVVNGLRFAAVPGDALEVSYNWATLERIKSNGERQSFQANCDTVINTSWEHFEDPAGWFSKIPKGKFVVIQANTNWDAEGHVACPADLEDLCSKTPFTERITADALPFGSHFRLMTAGIT